MGCDKTKETGMNNFRISASVSCMDLCHLARHMEEVDQANVSFYHFDVVDGRFNECFILGESTLKCMRKETKIPIEVHLGVYEPEKYLETYIKAGADYIAVHYEAMEEPLKVLRKIKALGAKPILAYRAETASGDDFITLANEVEWILKLTVNPGYAGQTMQQQAVDHIREMRNRLNGASMKTSIQADGNINLNTIAKVVDAGADILTGGTSGMFIEGKTVKVNCDLMLATALAACTTE